MFKPIKPGKGRTLDEAIDISSYGHNPYNLFSPFTYSPDFKIPVPGQDEYANSVESIWQGLKVINGQTDFSLFNKKPKKRKGHVKGHLYRDEISDIFDARLNIYKPSYFYYVEKYIPEEVKDDLLKKVFDEWEVYLHDIENNLDLENPQPLAHSVFAAEYMNNYLNKKLEKVRKEIDLFYDSIKPEQTLAEPVSRAVKFFENSSEIERVLAIHFLRSSARVRNIYHANYYCMLFDRLQRL